MGIVPFEGQHGLEEALRLGSSATHSFRHHVVAKWISAVGEFFAFFALVTSFLGIGLGLYDFLADGLKLRGSRYEKGSLTLLVAIPSLIFAINYPRAFIIALETTGGFGDTVLNGLIPALMVWSGRYVQRCKGHFRVWGGRSLLLAIVLFALFVLGVEIAERIRATPL